MTNKIISLLLISIMLVSFFAPAGYSAKYDKDKDLAAEDPSKDLVGVEIENEIEEPDETAHFDFSIFNIREDKEIAPAVTDSGSENKAAPLVQDAAATLKLTGKEYRTDLFTGSASYTYPLDVPEGINDLKPVVAFYYNHHSTLGISSPVGSGWDINVPMIIRDINATRSNTGDDIYKISLNGVNDELVYVASEGRYHTKHESYLWIKKISGGANEKGDYWVIKAKDGTLYRFGYFAHSELVSNLEPFVVAWYLDEVQDTHLNIVKYTYTENPSGNEGISYLTSIKYNQNYTSIDFNYQFGLLNIGAYYQNGLRVKTNGLLKSVSINQNGHLVRRYKLDHNSPNPVGISPRMYLKNIAEIGSNGLSELPATSFTYNEAILGWNSQPSLNLPSGVSFGDTKDEGVRLIDVDSDGKIDIVRAKNTESIDYWKHTGNNWETRPDISGVVTGFVDQNNEDQGVRFADLNGDMKLDLLQIRGGTSPVRKALVNTGKNWTAIPFSTPNEIIFTELASACYPDTCPSGYEDKGISCSGTTCTRTCERLTCSPYGSTVLSGPQQYPAWNDNGYDEQDQGTSFNPQPNKCYDFQFTGSPKEDTSSSSGDSECYDLTTDDDYISGVYDIDCYEDDIDAYAAIGFGGNGQSSSWLSTLPYGNDYGFVGNVENSYWRYKYVSYFDRDSSPDTSGSDAGDWDGLDEAICDEAGTQFISCAPSAYACDQWGRGRCGYGCASELTKPFIVQGVYRSDYGDLRDALDDRWECSSQIEDNDYKGYGDFRVIEYDVYHNYVYQQCHLPMIDTGQKTIDVNGDGMVDVIKAKGGQRKTWINTGTGFIENADWTLPVDIIGVDGSDSGVRLADLNGDGMIDIIKSRTGSPQLFWLNVGKNWQQISIAALPITFVDGNGLDRGVQIADINGDGFADLIQIKQSERGLWINRGLDTQWEPHPELVPSDSSIDLTKIHSQLSDIDNEGNIDIVVASTEERKTFVNNATKAYLLSTISNGLGDSVSLSYTKIADLDNTGGDGISDLAFSGMVVQSVAYDNGFEGNHKVHGVYNYTYESGLFDPARHEFRGFKHVTETLPDETAINHTFHQDEARKGLEETKQITKDAKTSSETSTAYNVSVLQGYYNVMPVAQTEKIFNLQEGHNEKRTEYVYDSYGNILNITNLGDTAIFGDEYTTSYEYLYNTTSWIVEKQKTITEYNSSISKLSETRFIYDGTTFGAPPTKGDLTSEEEWLSTSSGPKHLHYYDSFGNIVKETNARGFNTFYQYDPTHRFKTEEKNALGHATIYIYDPIDDNLLEMRDANDYSTIYTYDEFGREIAKISPYNSLNYPTVVTSYTPSTVGMKITTNEREYAGTSETLDTHSYYDGFGNLLQEKKEGETSFIVQDKYYDGLMRPSGESIPYYGPSQYTPAAQVPATHYNYDSLGRVTQIIYADGTNTSIVYDGWTKQEYDEKNHRIDKIHDGDGNILQVIEYAESANYTTSYNYDSLGNIISITNSAGNTLTYMYDTLGRKIRLSDGDLGTWTYTYDLENNLVEQRDARNQTITLVYDGLNRIIKKGAGGNTLIYGYDDSLKGTLSSIENQVFKKTYTYDHRYRPVKEIILIGPKSFTTQYQYDSLNRIVNKTLPTGETLQLAYNSQGRLQNLGSIVTISYNERDVPRERNYANQKTTEFTYHPAMTRIAAIVTDSVQNLSYTYDAAGNTKTIADGVTGSLETFEYDFLNRLISAKRQAFNESYALSYVYDRIGNMLTSINNITRTDFIYSGTPVHAPHTIITAPISDYGLELFYPLALLINGTTPDTSPYNRTGYAHAIQVVQSVRGPVFRFSVGDWVKSQDVDLGNSFTLSAWIKLDANVNESGQPTMRIVDKSLGGLNWPSYTLFVNNANKVALSFRPNNTQTNQQIVQSQTTLQKGKWYFIATTLGNGTLKIYVNGVLNGTNTNIGNYTPYNNNNPIFIGAAPSTSGTTSNHFIGALSDIRIHNRMLNSTEIKDIYE